MNDVVVYYIGIPTHDIMNEPVSKGVLKKCQKEYAKQTELYEKYCNRGQGVAGSDNVEGGAEEE